MNAPTRAAVSLTPIAVLRTIAQDMAEDAKAFDGQPFTGRTVAEYMGRHGAAIASLAEILADFLGRHEDVDDIAEPPVVSEERAEEIRGELNGFIEHEYETGTEVMNGIAVRVSTIVGTDFNRDAAVEWARAQPEVVAAGFDGVDQEGFVNLVDGTVIAWTGKLWEFVAGSGQ